MVVSAERALLLITAVGATTISASYDAAKQSLGASSQDRARFEKAGKKVEAAATALQRQASYTY